VPGNELDEVAGIMARKDSVTNMREVLIARRDALRKALKGDLSALKDLREQSGGDVVDFALDSAQDEINSQLAEVESRELASIDLALERMREGTFGTCEGCGNNIPLIRLQALPYATCCINCQQELERHGISGSPANWSEILGDDAMMNDLEMDVS
jgi:DnaK suppressor protein